MAEELRGLRIITNLHCNYHCKFCYQKRKTPDILDLADLRKQVDTFPDKYFEYCTIMGGESTLLPDLAEYIKIGKKYSKQVRLTTNGSLLTKKSLQQYKDAGLDGITISIATLDKYQETTGSWLTRKQILDKVRLVRKMFPDVRINIALCEQNMDGEIRELVDLFVSKMRMNITICESMTKDYSCLENPEFIDSRIVEDTGYGLVFMEHKGRTFGYYSHKDNYKHTDLVVTPVGTWTNWDGYGEVVNTTEVRK